MNSDVATSESQPLLPLSDFHNIPHETRLQWTKSISDLFFAGLKLKDRSCIRDWDLVLSLDGSVENFANNPSSTPSYPAKLYPARYRLPKVVLDRLSTNEGKIQRAELFALGSILYKVISSNKIFHEMGGSADDEEKIQLLIAIGEFPEDIWGLSTAPRILGCWCPAFAKEMLASRGKGTLFCSSPVAYKTLTFISSTFLLHEPSYSS